MGLGRGRQGATAPYFGLNLEFWLSRPSRPPPPIARYQPAWRAQVMQYRYPTLALALILPLSYAYLTSNLLLPYPTPVPYNVTLPLPYPCHTPPVPLPLPSSVSGKPYWRTLTCARSQRSRAIVVGVHPLVFTSPRSFLAVHDGAGPFFLFFRPSDGEA